MKQFKIYLVLLLIFSFMGTVYGQVLSPELEAIAKKMETELIAPCCWTHPLSNHSSPVAQEMKKDLRKMLAAGKTRQEILNYYVAKYDIAILSIPPQTGFNRLSFLMPIIFVLFGLGVVAIIIKIWIGYHQQHPVGSSATSPVDNNIDEEISKRIERELKKMD